MTPFSLAVLLRLRERKEQEQERVLVAIGNELKQLGETLRRVDQELTRWSTQRLEEVGSVSHAAIQHASYARYKALSDSRLKIQEHIRQAEARRAEQQSAYVSARKEREMLAELEQQQRNRRKLESAHREERAVADLYASRGRRR